jgi:predicted ribosomally synthesized peptide with SipW-like signal peptide
VKKIIFSLLAVALCVGMIGSAFAYFTDVETSSGNTMSAGTLNVQIANAGGPYGDTAVTGAFNSPDGLYPGQEFETLPVYIKNVGSIDVQRVYARFGNYSESDGTVVEPEGTGSANNIGDYLKLEYYAESLDGGAWQYETFVDGIGGQGQANADAYIEFWNGRGAGLAEDGVISLKDLVRARNYGSGDMVTTLCMLDGGNAAGPLHPNSTIAFKFKFQLVPETPNAIQGDSASFSVNFIASQLTTYPDETLWDSITERPLVP